VPSHIKAVFVLYALLASFLVLASVVTHSPQSLIAGLITLSLITAIRFAARNRAR